RTLSERLQWMDGPRHVTSPSSRPSALGELDLPRRARSAPPPQARLVLARLQQISSPLLHPRNPVVQRPVRPRPRPTNPPVWPQTRRLPFPIPSSPPRSSSPLGGRPPATLPSVASWAGCQAARPGLTWLRSWRDEREKKLEAAATEILVLHRRYAGPDY